MQNSWPNLGTIPSGAKIVLGTIPSSAKQNLGPIPSSTFWTYSGFPKKLNLRVENGVDRVNVLFVFNSRLLGRILDVVSL